MTFMSVLSSFTSPVFVFLLVAFVDIPRPAEAEVLRPDRERVLHSSDRPPGRQSFDGQGRTSGPNTATAATAARHGIPPPVLLSHHLHDDRGLIT